MPPSLILSNDLNLTLIWHMGLEIVSSQSVAGTNMQQQSEDNPT
jgi:hypothetical protein